MVEFFYFICFIPTVNIFLAKPTQDPQEDRDMVPMWGHLLCLYGVYEMLYICCNYDLSIVGNREKLCNTSFYKYKIDDFT